MLQLKQTVNKYHYFADNAHVDEYITLYPLIDRGTLNIPDSALDYTSVCGHLIGQLVSIALVHGQQIIILE